MIDKPKKRVKKDKEAPKKPMSPFFCYQAMRRQKLKQEQPDLNNPHIIKVSTHNQLDIVYQVLCPRRSQLGISLAKDSPNFQFISFYYHQLANPTCLSNNFCRR